MDRASVLAGAPFRTALYAVALFALVLFGAGWFAYKRVGSALQKDLEAQILEEQILLHEILRDGGSEALGRAVAELNSPISSQRHMVGLFDKDGKYLAGNNDRAPGFIGWQVTSSEQKSFLGLDDGHLLNASIQDSFKIVVGRSLAPRNKALTTLIEGLLLLGVVVLLTTLSLGYVLSRRNLLKLQTIEQTLNQVSMGNMAARLPVSSANDQIDRISAQVNEHLEQLSALMTTTQSSVAAIAHDLKTPLSHGFMALQQALAKLDRVEDPREELEDLGRELERLSSVFDTILRISRIETSGAQTYFDNLDLNDIVREMHDTFEAVAEEKGQSLVPGTVKSEKVMIWGDYKMLLQLAYNLVKNSIEHCPSGTKIKLLANEHESVPQLTMSDDGPGVADDLRASIFDPFFRTSSSRSSGGNGLGLALVRAIANRHGARVRAYDNNPGLKVIVTFPRNERLV